MTAVAAPPVRVRVHANPAAPGVVAGLIAALGMLSEARRIEVVGRDDRADIAHSIGIGESTADDAPQRVHTIDRIPLRRGRLAPSRSWVRTARRSVTGATACLVHGNTAARVLVEAGVVEGERVHCLPLLSVPDCACDAPDQAARTAVRERLGVAPGVRLVYGVEPGARPGRADDWDRVLLRAGRRDVLVGWIRPARAGDYFVRMSSGLCFEEAVPLPQLLAASDLFVATGDDLAAFTPAIAAAAAAIPLIAVTTDSAAELVLAQGRGCVVPPRADRIAHAVVAHLDGVPPSRAARDAEAYASHRLAELARCVLAVYRRVMCEESVGGAR